MGAWEVWCGCDGSKGIENLSTGSTQIFRTTAFRLIVPQRDTDASVRMSHLFVDRIFGAHIFARRAHGGCRSEQHGANRGNRQRETSTACAECRAHRELRPPANRARHQQPVTFKQAINRTMPTAPQPPAARVAAYCRQLAPTTIRAASCAAGPGTPFAASALTAGSYWALPTRVTSSRKDGSPRRLSNCWSIRIPTIAISRRSIAQRRWVSASFLFPASA
jgi:hypothetical protein